MLRGRAASGALRPGADVIFRDGRLVVGSGTCGCGLAVGVARPTSAAGGRDHRRAEPVVPRTGAGPRCRSSGSARMGLAGGCVRPGPPRPEGMGEHRQGGPAVPGAPAADLVLVKATEALAGLEGLLDRPAPAGDPDQDGQRGGVCSSGRRPARQSCDCGGLSASACPPGRQGRGRSHGPPWALGRARAGPGGGDRRWPRTGSTGPGW